MKITKPQIHSRNEKLYLHYSLNGKQIRKSLNLEDTKQNRLTIEIHIIPEMLKRAYSGDLEKSQSIPIPSLKHH